MTPPDPPPLSNTTAPPPEIDREAARRVGATLIVGGGISGLTCAWHLHRAGVPVRVLESRGCPGGSILTQHHGGYLVEMGPNSTLQKPGAEEDALGRLVQQLGLGDELVVANPAAERRYVARDGRLHPLPAAPPALLRSRLFSLGGKLRLLLEPFIGRAREEESIARFVTRRLGREFLDYAVEPFVSGVYAGDPRELSVRAAVPKIHRLEAQYGSLIRGAMAMGKALKGAGMPKGRMVSFKEGMAELPHAIRERLPPETVELEARVVALGREGNRWTVRWQRGETTFEDLAERVILAVPAPVAARLLQPLAPAAAASLQSIPYAPIASVALGYRRAQVRHPLDGFGALIPRREGVHTLGVLFSSTLFPERAREGQALLTAFIGGTMEREVLERDDQQLVELVQQELARYLDIQGAPPFIYLTRYRRAIPQYTLGHLARVAEIDAALAELPNLHTRANWRDGISVADCIRNAEALTRTLLHPPKGG